MAKHLNCQDCGKELRVVDSPLTAKLSKVLCGACHSKRLRSKA